MSRAVPLSILAPSVFFAAALSGCATYQGCGSGECKGDQKINSDVERLLDSYPALVGEIPITVQTKARIVYLNGVVATDLQRDTAEFVALEATGVAMVVNGIAVTEK
jgi:osmotically-inducible protein OsmY